MSERCVACGRVIPFGGACKCPPIPFRGNDLPTADGSWLTRHVGPCKANFGGIEIGENNSLPESIIVMSPGTPHWFFIAKKSTAKCSNGMVVYETLDPIMAKPLAPKVECIWPDCGHDGNHVGSNTGCNGIGCPKAGGESR